MRLSCGCDFENTDNINCALILRTDGGWRPQIQDTADPYYKKPKDLLEGCGCKKNCTLARKKCKCMSNENRGKQCSRLTCKFCPCFKRVTDGLNEDLQLSTTFQNFLDDISDDSHDSIDDLQLSTQYQKLTITDDLFPDSSDSSQHSDESVTSDTELVFSDFDEDFVDF